MLVVAFYSCYFFLNAELKKHGYNEKLASDIIFWSALGGILGAKIYYLIENINKVLDSNDPIGMIFSGAGLVFLGGLMGSIISVSFVLKRMHYRLNFANIIGLLIFLIMQLGDWGVSLLEMIMVFHQNFRGPCHFQTAFHQQQHIFFLIYTHG